MTFAVEVIVALKPVVNDPQGLVVRESLHRLGFAGVRAARVGKYIELEVDANDEASARLQVEQMCEQLLRNPVIELTYQVQSRVLSEAPSMIARGGEGMNCAGHGVGTPSPFRPSLSPGGVARAARWPASVRALPILAGE